MYTDVKYKKINKLQKEDYVMKYLVIEEKRMNLNEALRVIRRYYPRVRKPKSKRGNLQFYFPQSQLTKENVGDIAYKLGMRVIKLSGVRAVIGYE